MLQRLLADCRDVVVIDLSPRPEEGCNCSVKTALVPAYGLDAWRFAMALSPFRPLGVVVRWPYLGISAGTRRLEVEGDG
eukprot:14900947-Alexandrium_andersonii.AAC.1